MSLQAVAVGPTVERAIFLAYAGIVTMMPRAPGGWALAPCQTSAQHGRGASGDGAHWQRGTVVLDARWHDIADSGPKRALRAKRAGRKKTVIT